MVVYQDFSKADKKLFQPLTQLAVKREIKIFVVENKNAYAELTEKEHEDIRVPFWELNDKFREFSKHLVGVYDRNSHRYLPSTVVGLWIKNVLTESDFDKFSPEGKQKLLEMKEFMIRTS